MCPKNLARTGARSQLDRYVWALAALWTVAVAASLTWNVIGGREAEET